MRKTALLLICLISISCSRKESMNDIADRVFDLAVYQLELLDSNLSIEELPRTIKNGELLVSDTEWWCSGFFPGCLCYTALYTGDGQVASLADKYTHYLDSLYLKNISHDIGFMLNCSFGNHMKVFPEAAAADSSVLKKGAAKLAGRYSDITRTTRSWDFGKWKWPVIIDNMMNLELLMKFGCVEHQKIAINHAKQTMANHFRPDYSCYHVVDYDPESGEVIGKMTHQGYSDSSAWARGQAWALYGYTMMAVLCKEKGYPDDGKIFQEQACKIADMLLARLPEDGIPAWDFDAPAPAPKDASAAAIMASAFVELGHATSGRRSRAYIQMAEKQIRRLASPDYLSEKGRNFGFLLLHSVGNYPRNSEVDVPLSYADYYFLEALYRISGR